MHILGTMMFEHGGKAAIPVDPNACSALCQDGVFHYNTFLSLDLASPFFSHGAPQESFEVMVMENKDDGHIR